MIMCYTIPVFQIPHLVGRPGVCGQDAPEALEEPRQDTGAVIIRPVIIEGSHALVKV